MEKGTSKIQELIQKKPTEERVSEVSKLLNIRYDMALKYFKKTCSCGKKLNPGEIAMFLKTQGRFEGMEDNRQYLCKDCLCEIMNWSKDEYKEKAIQFSEQGCNLF